MGSLKFIILCPLFHHHRTKGRSRRIWRRYNEQSRHEKEHDELESGWVEALEATRIYGFSKYRGARENSLKVVVTVTPSKPGRLVVETALKLRKQYGTIIYAIGIDNQYHDELAGLTGDGERIINTNGEQELPLMVGTLRKQICSDISSCSTIRFQV